MSKRFMKSILAPSPAHSPPRRFDNFGLKWAGLAAVLEPVMAVFDWRVVEWWKKDSVIAREIGYTRERVRQVRKQLGLPSSQTIRPEMSERRQVVIRGVHDNQTRTFSDVCKLICATSREVSEACAVLSIRLPTEAVVCGRVFFVDVPGIGKTKFSGPTVSVKGKHAKARRYLHVQYPCGKSTTMTYARFLMQQHLGWTLREDDSVDHINEDPLDDRLENLQVLSPSENTRKSMRIRFGSSPFHNIPLVLTCAHCSNSFARSSVRSEQLRIRRGQRGPFCGRSCWAKSLWSERKRRSVPVLE